MPRDAFLGPQAKRKVVEECKPISEEEIVEEEPEEDHHIDIVLIVNALRSKVVAKLVCDFLEKEILTNVEVVNAFREARALKGESDCDGCLYRDVCDKCSKGGNCKLVENISVSITNREDVEKLLMDSLQDAVTTLRRAEALARERPPKVKLSDVVYLRRAVFEYGEKLRKAMAPVESEEKLSVSEKLGIRKHGNVTS
jgi:hypothetical protein